MASGAYVRRTYLMFEVTWVDRHATTAYGEGAAPTKVGLARILARSIQPIKSSFSVLVVDRSNLLN